MKKEFNYDEAFEITGRWRFCGLKEIDEEEYAGTLAYDPNKRQLILSVDFYEEDVRVVWKLSLTKKKNIPLIQGRIIDGNISLLSCRQCGEREFEEGGHLRAKISYNCSILLAHPPLDKEERGIHGTSGKDLLFTKARVEYKNLSYWSEGRKMNNNLTELRGKKDDSLKMDIDILPKKETISETLTHREYVCKEESRFKNGIFDHVDIIARSFIDFDFKEEISLGDLVKQINFLRDLLHFAMLPKMSTYPLTEWVVNTKGNRYQLFLPPPRLPIREKDNPSTPNDCFIPYQYIKKIGECFKTSKKNENVRLLLRFFLKSSYMMGDIADHEEMYVNTYTLLERASFIVSKEPDKPLKSNELVSSFVKGLPEGIKKLIKSHKKWEKQLENIKSFIKKVVDYRNGIVHGDANTIEYDANDMLGKIPIMYVCITYQIQKKIFKFSDEEIADNYVRYLSYPFDYHSNNT